MSEAQNVTSCAYDDENNLLSITDANGHATAFSYDTFGRVKQTTFPSALTETYVYDAIGNLTSKTDRNGNAIGYVYDALNRLTHKGYPDSTGVDYIYDLAGKIQQVNDPTGSYGFAYDALGRQVSKTDQANKSTNYGYDALGPADLGDPVFKWESAGQQLRRSRQWHHTNRRQLEHHQLRLRSARTAR